LTFGLGIIILQGVSRRKSLAGVNYFSDRPVFNVLLNSKVHLMLSSCVRLSKLLSVSLNRSSHDEGFEGDLERVAENLKAIIESNKL
jgi:hypothetical protein